MCLCVCYYNWCRQSKHARTAPSRSIAPTRPWLTRLQRGPPTTRGWRLMCVVFNWRAHKTKNNTARYNWKIPTRHTFRVCLEESQMGTKKSAVPVYYMCTPHIIIILLYKPRRERPKRLHSYVRIRVQCAHGGNNIIYSYNRWIVIIIFLSLLWLLFLFGTVRTLFWYSAVFVAVPYSITYYEYIY